MYLQGLKLTNFKNYECQTIDLSAKLNCFVGENGVGKTNLLDAIHYLCMCKSHFSLPDKQVIRHQEDFFRLEGVFQRNQKKESIVCKYAPKIRKVIERNKLAYKRFADHIGLLPMIMITPDDTLLITEGSENRRQFIDVLLVQLDAIYLEHLMTYNKILQQRNAFLKSFKHPLEVNYELLEIYSQQLLKPAQYIHEKRQQIIGQLKPIFQTYYKAISGDKEQVDLKYQSQLLECSFADLLQESQEKDTWLQRTTKGIHKDDLKLLINGYPVKKFASQGQLKSYLLALKLAQYELLRQESEVAPLVLLDDIFDKLDKKRVQQLLELLLERDFGQIFITDTHENRIVEIVSGLGTDYKQFQVNNGVATEMQKVD
ncbi:DNA replication/repair protein RecF [Aureispira anguillae]|uniref:DNA replication and repair protein RecF n=1 Tax=Aureispira anguillae TaxID=2864201 RepID=A0A916DSQ5_9BACT|nr:DNA replication/repair protein RecF [Aureispira anguillae]BDS12036.1 DNA replication/repair protein RecF [Aureispira anguillae]